ncbi:hypothetical protein [Rhizosaccharibacter radicis]|uniref:Uncharacterized protein n=1 Tax=Rhizosaccharibacter radicis TaxID=2782605 RepID=A0ABT1W143_9PROT|nr:hypothetical protein [Acetobacteraceae bacterium KSS12]
MKSQEFPVPPPPRDGREHADKEHQHETKPGQKDNAFARTQANHRIQETPAGSIDHRDKD